MDSKLLALLERAVVALERLTVPSVTTSTVAEAPAAEVTDIVQDIVKDVPFTLDVLKSVSAPFKAANQLVLLKEALTQLGVAGVSELATRKSQLAYLVMAKDKASLLPEPQAEAAKTIITTIINGAAQ